MGMPVDKALQEAIAKLGAVYSKGSSLNPGWSYNPIPFPEFENIPCHRLETSYSRWQVLQSFINDWKSKVVLDIGCNVGFFSFQALKMGGRVYGVELDNASRRVCQLVTKKYKLDGKFTKKINFKIHYDIVLAFSVLNWMGKSESEYILNNLDNNLLFVEMPLDNDGMGGASWLKTLGDFETWITASTPYKNFSLLSSQMAPGGKERWLYVFTRS